MEKLVLMLVFVAKRLRWYFQAHPIAVITDQILFIDGSSCVDGSDAGLILTSPEGAKFNYALRFQFTASNNDPEYEALIAGLRIAAQMGVCNVHVSVDSKLVANQVLGTYVAKEENMIKYLEKVKSLVNGFASFSINQLPQRKNKEAYALSKIVSTSFAHLSKQVLVEILKEKSIQEEEVATVIEEEGTTWMTPIMEYLKDGTLPGDRKEASKLRIRARQYELLVGILYRRSFLKPWLRTAMSISQGYAAGILLANHAPGCTRNDTKVKRLPNTSSPGPFPEGPGKVKFLIVAMDYFTKWIEAKVTETLKATHPLKGTPLSSIQVHTGLDKCCQTKVLLPHLCLYRCDSLHFTRQIGIRAVSSWLGTYLFERWKLIQVGWLKPENKTGAEWTILHRQGIINQLAGMGIKFEGEIQGLWLLDTLPDTWETFSTSLSNSAPDGVITIELANGSILNEEMRRKSQGSSSHSDVLVTERQGRSKSRGPSNRGNHRSSSSKGKFADVECYHCHKKGHTMKFCRQLKKENKKKNYNNQKNKHKKDDDGDDSTKVNTTIDEFFVCSNYDMVNPSHDDSSDFGVVRMGNTGLSRIAGIGDICLKFDTGMELVLHNVKHVPDMRLNIISTGLLDEDDYHNSSGNGLWKVTLGSLIVARGKRESKLYMTHPKISKSIVNAIDNDDMTELWHKRLGHMSEKGMSILSKKNVLSGVHDINLKKCSHCLAGKQTRLAFKSRSPFRMKNILDLVHSDVCGPMKTKTLGGCSYFVTFIDDHSRKVWVYTLKTKDQVLDVFKQFHALVERQTGKKLKCIRSDNRGEYIGPFDAYCKEHGIQHQKTSPKTPQLNGLAERMNKTLVERVRCLLSHAGLPASFWGEALNTAVHVINLTPCVPLRFDVPDRVWSDKDVLYHHLRVFGCKASVHIPKDERLKLDVKNKPYPVPPKYFDAQFGDDIQNDDEQNDEEHGADDVDAQEQPNLNEDIHPELPVPMPPFVPLRRSTRDHHPSTRYSANENIQSYSST
ncbi:putative RNA-directed DNA polymerase [Tanacetum coccineum]